MLLGFVLGPLMEENLRRAMLIARGDVTRLLHPADLGGRCWRSALLSCWCCGAADDPQEARRGVRRIARLLATKCEAQEERSAPPRGFLERKRALTEESG